MRLSDVEDEDEAFSVEVEVDFTEDDDATYCNWVSPYVVLEKLAQYIKRKQEDDTSFENEYKVTNNYVILSRCCAKLVCIQW